MSADTPEVWQALYDAIGGRAGLARICDVSESTVWRWSRGETSPSRLVRVTVNGLCDSHGVPQVFTEEKKEETHAKSNEGSGGEGEASEQEGGDVARPREGHEADHGGGARG